MSPGHSPLRRIPVPTRFGLGNGFGVSGNIIRGHWHVYLNLCCPTIIGRGEFGCPTIKHATLISTCVLGFIHSQVGIVEQIIRWLSWVVTLGDAKTHGYLDRRDILGDRKLGRFDGFAHGFRLDIRLAGRRIRHQDRILLAAEACDCIRIPSQAL